MPKRKQDIWNEKVGYISKSYKVYKNIADDFATVCTNNHSTQSGELLKFMKHYIHEFERRNGGMKIKEKYGRNDQNSTTLETLVNKKISEITDKDIAEEVKNISDHIYKLDRGQKYSDLLEYNKRFETRGDLTQYLTQGAEEIVNYVKQRMITQFAIFILVQRLELMPLYPRGNSNVEVNIEHKGGNSLFDFYFDLFPYDTFLIIKSESLLDTEVQK